MKTCNRPLDLCGPITEWSHIEAASPADGADTAPKKLRRFSMTAYTGGAMDLPGWNHPVVVDLDGLSIASQSRPILKDHNRAWIVGHTDRIEVVDRQLLVTGVISGAGPVAQEVIASSENGFPWRASIGAKGQRMVFISAGRKVAVNGREFTGPIYVARKAVLGEISFVAMAADENTTAQVAAGATSSFSEPDQPSQPTEVLAVQFDAWITAQGFVPDELNETQTANLKVLFEASQKQAESQETDDDPKNDDSKDEGPNDIEASGAAGNAEGAIDDGFDPIAERRAAYADDLRRIDAIEELCGAEHRKIAAQAIAEGWDVSKTELAVLRASRPQAPAVGSSAPPCNARILEAAACLSAGVAEDDLVTEYGQQTLEAAYPMRHIGMRELVAECARLEGHDIPRVFGDGAATIRAGFSTMSLPGIMENVMNKTLLAAYQNTPIAAFSLCAVGSVSDFKEVSRYRLLGTGGFEQVAPDGELKHGKLGEEKYTNKAETYGQILMLTRRDIINDDLNAFLDIPRQMGRSGAEVIDDLFFTLLLSNPGTFFGSGNGNFLSGTDTAFGSDSLTRAKTLFRKQKAGPGSKAKDKKPINVRPVTLVVPVELETEAELLIGAAQIMVATGSDTTLKVPTDNPHRNKYRVVSVPHLSDTYYTGASSKAWYLFAEPNVIPAFELVFLNGRRTPIIERVEAPPNMLGMGFRSYLDVGLKEQNPKGAVKIKGEA